MPETHLTRHAGAMLAPAIPEEATLTNLIGELGRIGDRYKADGIMLDAVEKLASATLALLEADTGRMDPTVIRKQVLDIVRRAGGETHGL